MGAPVRLLIFPFRVLLFVAVIRPFLAIVLGLQARGRELLPVAGPAIVVANHNSHLDTAVLMSLFPVSLLGRIRPVAAADYFLSNPVLSWFSRHIVGIIPVQRRRAEGSAEDPLAPISESLRQGNIVLFFPEGTRGEPEVMVDFKKGIAKLAERHPEVPIVPVFLHGLGKSLPRGEAIFVPFLSHAVIGESVRFGVAAEGGQEAFLQRLREEITRLAESLKVAAWL
ncbi:MAG: 1-acyl-sn-glycerol-3-phosphate acyltransferase [Oligoflexia bacterium]|nr:1-acyl-sn-glycerol-3-phosphate acyltransferase [Oligoflexia bacterium]